MFAKPIKDCHFARRVRIFTLIKLLNDQIVLKCMEPCLHMLGAQERIDICLLHTRFAVYMFKLSRGRKPAESKTKLKCALVLKPDS